MWRWLRLTHPMWRSVRQTHRTPHWGALEPGSGVVVVAAARVDVELRHLRRMHDERPHHALVLVVEDVAVVHELTGRAGELPGHGHPLPGLHLEDVLPALLVLLDRPQARSRRGQRRSGAANRHVEA